MEPFFSIKLRELLATAETVVDRSVAPQAEEVDRSGEWPAQSLRALAEAGLLGLHVPTRLGGHQQGLLALTSLTEVIAKGCSSSALCFGMHCVGTAVLAAKATAQQEERYLRPIAEGRHLTTLALSEAGTGVHFYLPQTQLARDGEGYVLHGTKQFVTNGGHADSYVLSTQASRDASSGEFTCLIVDQDAPGLSWVQAWNGFGMRGNSSRTLELDGTRVGLECLLGEEGDQIWYVFEIVAPYFLMAMAGTYLGIAQAAVDLAVQHVQSRQYAHSGESLAEAPVLQHRLGEIWAAVERTRALIYRAAYLGDLGDPRALAAILASKVEAADTAVQVTNQAMTLCGGIAYRENSHLARLLRDARASHVMSPTTDVLKQWIGRSLLGLPIL